MINKYKLAMIVLASVFVVSCAEKTTGDSSKEDANNKAEKSEVTVVKTEEEKVKTGSSSPKSSKPISELEPVDESERNSEVKIVPNQYPLEHLKKEEEKEKDQKNKKEEGKEEDDTKP